MLRPTIEGQNPARTLRFDAATLAFAGLMLAASVLVLFRLDAYPKAYFDEGWYLQVPINWLQHGVYGTHSSEGFRPSDTASGVSIAFYAPFVAAFSVFGPGLLLARLVVAVQFLGACALIWAVARTLYRPSAAAAPIALALFIFVRADDIFTSALLLGRQAMAEIPSLGYFLAGMLCWLAGVERRAHQWLFASGILFGLALTVKAQFLLIIPPVLVGLAAVDRLYYRQRRLSLFVVPLLGMGGLYAAHHAFLWTVLGAESYSEYLVNVYASSGPQVRVLFSADAMKQAFTFLTTTSYVALFVPAVAYAIVRCMRRDPDNIKECLPVAFVLIWMAWYCVSSAGWSRYAFPAMAISYILAGKMLSDFSGRFQDVRAVAASGDGRATAAAFRPIGVALFLAAFLAIGSRDTLRGIFVRPDRTAQEMAAFIETNVAAGSLIETWEWELTLLAPDHAFHLPPLSAFNHALARYRAKAPYDPAAYDFARYQPDYLLIGWFGSLADLYPKEFLAQRGTLVASIGEYRLYRIAM